MPEAVTDRPTESHEYILMLTKSARYYWDQEAVREPAQNWGTRDRSDNKYTLEGLANGLESETNPNGRNIRSVWTFTTQPYREAHFATFPEALPETCIKAATPEVGSCEKCGAPWERIVERDNCSRTRPIGVGQDTDEGTQGRAGEVTTTTLGWQPTCKCGVEEKSPAIVLDPFAGSGTTLWVAKKLGRRAVGYELSREYCDLIIERNRQQGLF